MPTEPINTFSLFAVSVAVGIAALLPVVPLAQIGRRFFVLTSLLSVIFVALAIGVTGIDIGYLYLVFAGLLIVYNLLLPRQSGVDWSERRESRFGGPRTVLTFLSQCILLAAIGVGAVALVIEAHDYPVPLEFRVAPAFFVAATFIGSALLLGGSVVAMVLGHWYLVARQLSFAPLARICLVLIAVLALRILTAGISAWAQLEFWSDAVSRTGLMSFMVHPGMFVLTRVLFGFVAPLVLLWMTWKCVQIRSNQSATGILYVTVVFVLIGEIIAKYLLVSQRFLI